MGNFYTNVVVRGADPQPAIAALKAERRHAFVTVVDDVTFVYDERCDSQEPDELRAAAKLLSQAYRAPALASINHDDDVLWLAVARDGTVVDVYDSFPGFFDGGSDQPLITNLDALCDAFGVSAQRAQIETLLKVPHAEVGFEVRRHAHLLEMLAIDAGAGTLGFNYVAQGDFEESMPDVEMHEVGEDSR
jgi:hypothetical protein